MHRKILNTELKKLTESFLLSAIDREVKSSPIESKLLAKDVSSYIDHTLLKPDATLDQLETLCEEAKKYQFKAVCIPPSFLNRGVALLKDSAVLPITVVGFPLGYQTTATKVFETQNAITLGAQEIDMVINTAALKSGDLDLVYQDIRQVVQAAQGITVKVIVETAYLSLEDKAFLCACVQLSGAKYIKTSTGFAPTHANLDDILLFKRLLGSRVKIKASGGIKTHEQAAQFIDAGADRIGTSSGVAIATQKVVSDDKAY